MKRYLTRFQKLFSKFNSSEKAYLVGQSLYLYLHLSVILLIPILVKAVTGNTALTGVVRAVHYFVLGICSLFAGAIIAHKSMKSLLSFILLTRAILVALVALLLLGHIHSFTIFLLIVGVNGVCVSFNYLLDIDMIGGNRIFTSTAKKETALYLFRLMIYIVLIIAPLIIGVILNALEEELSLATSAAIGLLIFSFPLLIVRQIYSRGITPIETFPTDSDMTSQMLHIWSAIKVIWNNKAILNRTLLSALEHFVDDALMYVVLPTLALDILMVGVMGNGMLVSSLNLGGICASLAMLKYAKKAQKKLGFYRFLFRLSCLAACLFIPSIALWGHPPLWLAIAAVFLMRMLYEPLSARMHVMLQVSINNDPVAKPKEAGIFAFLTTLETFSAGLGALAFAWLFTHSAPGSLLHTWFGDNATMKVLTLFLMIIGIIIWLGLLMIKREAIRTFHSTPAQEAETNGALQMLLDTMKLPPYEMERPTHHIASDCPCVVILGAPTISKLALIREGGRLFPGNIHLAIDPSWLIREMQPDQTNRLFLKKGLYFNHYDCPIIAEYRHPRPVHYFANFFSPYFGKGLDGIPIEEQLDIPMSSSVQLERLVNEKLFTRLLLAQKKLQVPATLAFLMQHHPFRDSLIQYNDIEKGFYVVPFFEPELEPRERLKSIVVQFLAYRQNEEFVIRPSAPAFHSGRGTKFFKQGDIEAMIDHIISLSKDPNMIQQGAILIDTRVITPPLYLQIGREDENGRFCYLRGMAIPLHIMRPEEIEALGEQAEKKEWNMHILVSRTPWNGAVVTGILAHAGQWGLPAVATPDNPEKAAAVVQFEDIVAALRIQYGLLTTDDAVWQFKSELEDIGITSLTALIEDEAKRPHHVGEPYQAQTDYIGVTVMIKLKGEKLFPQVIDISDHNAGGQYQLDGFYSEKMGEHSRAWIYNMLARARRHIMKEKRLLLVGSGDPGNMFLFEKAKEFELKLILIDKSDSWARDLVSEYIPLDMTHPLEALNSVKKPLLKSISSHGAVNGITTAIKEETFFTALLAREFQLSYLTVETAMTLRNKFKMRELLRTMELSVPLHFLLKNEHDLEVALSKILVIQQTSGDSHFPMLLSSPVETMLYRPVKVENIEEARQGFAAISKEIVAKRERVFILEEFIKGVKWNANIILQSGKIVFKSLYVDSEPDEINPIAKHLSLQAQKASMDLAILTAYTLGCADGVLHIKGVHNAKKGAYVLEIQAQPERLGVTVNSKLWGVDLIEMLFITTLKIPLIIHKSERPIKV